MSKSEYTPLTGEGHEEGFIITTNHKLIAGFVLLVATVLVIVLPVYFFVLKEDECKGQQQILNGNIAPGWCVSVIWSGLGQVRRLVTLENGDILMLERNESWVMQESFGRIWLISYNETWDYSKTLLVDNAPLNCSVGGPTCLNDALAYWKGYIYAASVTTLYRWEYTIGSKNPLNNYEIVVDNMPATNHRTRTLVFDDAGFFYIAVGSEGNIDLDTETHSQIRQFNYSIIELNSSLPIDYTSGKVWAQGVRNEAGMALDSQGRLWGVENGIDEIERPDLAPNISRDNPSEEVNLFDGPEGSFYGYPYCWSEGVLPANVSRGPGSQWVTEQFLSANYSDEWCVENSIRPKYNLQAHSSPLDMKFYYGSLWSDIYGSLFVSRHGSNHDNLAPNLGATGYDILRLDFSPGNDVPRFGQTIVEWKYIKAYGVTEQMVRLNWHRFVGMDWGECIYGKECLYFVSDNQEGPTKGIFGVLSRDK